MDARFQCKPWTGLFPHPLDKDNTGANAINMQDMARHNTTGSTEQH